MHAGSVLKHIHIGHFSEGGKRFLFLSKTPVAKLLKLVLDITED
jgi:hypothetical protein